MKNQHIFWIIWSAFFAGMYLQKAFTDFTWWRIVLVALHAACVTFWVLLGREERKRAQALERHSEYIIKRWDDLDKRWVALLDKLNSKDNIKETKE